ncbi:DUF6300 family protein [Nonomuraea angiospora]|uniref:DUF6300 family protein n=1 Tax=Nonomuraea angiospora TaxID=46172 RepID=UPI0034242B83
MAGQRRTELRCRYQGTARAGSAVAVNRRIEVISSDDAPECPRCGRAGLLYARVPNGWYNAAGARVDGYTGVVLCSDCDPRDLLAAPLISWFHVNGEADDEDHEFVRLFIAWATNVFVPMLNEQALEDEIEQWRRDPQQLPHLPKGICPAWPTR